MEWNEVYNQMLMGAILLMVTIVLPFFLGKLFSALTAWSVEMVEKRPLIYDIAVEAVHFAEQAGLGSLAEEKKQLAVDYAERELKNLGIDIDLDIVADKIEAALFAEINQFAGALEKAAKG